jgi:ribosomal protein S27AE
MEELNSCLTIQQNKFFWWKWESRWYNHDWGYIDNEHRKCMRCGRFEMLFKIDNHDGYIIEDWRQWIP